MKEWKIKPPEDLKGRDDFESASSPALNRPEHVVSSGSIWFCTNCGEKAYCQYEHGIKEMLAFIAGHKDCV